MQLKTKCEVRSVKCEVRNNIFEEGEEEKIIYDLRLLIYDCIFDVRYTIDLINLCCMN
jgi:hypothetical protein